MGGLALLVGPRGGCFAHAASRAREDLIESFANTAKRLISERPCDAALPRLLREPTFAVRLSHPRLLQLHQV
jgi:hypothetical protein